MKIIKRNLFLPFIVFSCFIGMILQSKSASAAVSATMTNTKDPSITANVSFKTSDNSNGGKIKKILKLKLKTGSMKPVTCKKFKKSGKTYTYKSKKYGGILKIKVYNLYKIKITQKGCIDYPKETYGGTYTWGRL